MLAMQSLVSALGQRLRGRAWLLVTGQQQLDDQNDGQILGKMKDRFPPSLRVHLDTVNILDVVHRRLLQKLPAREAGLRELYDRYSSNLRLFSYQADDITQDEFVDIYPMLPGHIDLIMKITSALRTRSRRSQGDDHAIRGLLQLLGELFRAQGLADDEVGTLITLDRIFEVQGSALDIDVQQTLERIWRFCDKAKHKLAARCAKAVALLELLQGDEENKGVATDTKLVARCLYADLRDDDNEPAVREALELLRRENLLGYSERRGYKIQSSAGQDWETERRNLQVPQEDRAESIREALETLVGDAGRPQLQGRGFPWLGLFSNEGSHDQQPLRSTREEAPITVDFRYVPDAAQDPAIVGQPQRRVELQPAHPLGGRPASPGRRADRQPRPLAQDDPPVQGQPRVAQLRQAPPPARGRRTRGGAARRARQGRGRGLHGRADLLRRRRQRPRRLRLVVRGRVDRRRHQAAAGHLPAFLAAPPSRRASCSRSPSRPCRAPIASSSTVISRSSTRTPASSWRPARGPFPPACSRSSSASRASRARSY
jgi:hypothetical protein